MAVPEDVPALAIGKKIDLNAISISVECIETDDTDYVIYESTRYGAFYGNEKLWCNVLATSMQKKLKSYGAIIDNTAANKIKIDMSTITGRSGHSTVGFNANFSVLLDNGWKKTYEGHAAAHKGLTTGRMANRAASYTIYEAMKKIIGDDDFISEIKTRSR
jgi:hypothetical protein